jgi:hypothetical protein
MSKSWLRSLLLRHRQVAVQEPETLLLRGLPARWLCMSPMASPWDGSSAGKVRASCGCDRRSAARTRQVRSNRCATMASTASCAPTASRAPRSSWSAATSSSAATMSRRPGPQKVALHAQMRCWAYIGLSTCLHAHMHVDSRPCLAMDVQQWMFCMQC